MFKTLRHFGRFFMFWSRLIYLKFRATCNGNSKLEKTRNFFQLWMLRMEKKAKWKRWPLPFAISLVFVRSFLHENVGYPLFESFLLKKYYFVVNTLCQEITSNNLIFDLYHAGLVIWKANWLASMPQIIPGLYCFQSSSGRKANQNNLENTLEGNKIILYYCLSDVHLPSISKRGNLHYYDRSAL